MLCSSAPGLAAEDDGTGGCGCAADWTGASAIDGVSPGCMHLAATGFRLPSTRPWDCDPGIPASLQNRGWFCFALAARDPTTQLLFAPHAAGAGPPPTKGTPRPRAPPAVCLPVSAAAEIRTTETATAARRHGFSQAAVSSHRWPRINPSDLDLSLSALSSSLSRIHCIMLLSPGDGRPSSIIFLSAPSPQPNGHVVID